MALAREAASVQERIVKSKIVKSLCTLPTTNLLAASMKLSGDELRSSHRRTYGGSP